MITVAEPLVTSRFKDSDFKKDTVLNANVTVEMVGKRIEKSVTGNLNKRRNSRVRACKATKY